MGACHPASIFSESDVRSVLRLPRRLCSFEQTQSRIWGGLANLCSKWSDKWTSEPEEYTAVVKRLANLFLGERRKKPDKPCRSNQMGTRRSSGVKLAGNALEESAAPVRTFSWNVGKRIATIASCSDTPCGWKSWLTQPALPVPPPRLPVLLIPWACLLRDLAALKFYARQLFLRPRCVDQSKPAAPFQACE